MADVMTAIPIRQHAAMIPASAALDRWWALAAEDVEEPVLDGIDEADGRSVTTCAGGVGFGDGKELSRQEELPVSSTVNN